MSLHRYNVKGTVELAIDTGRVIGMGSGLNSIAS